MGYRYITENNLYHKQNYMYSDYKGIDFIKEYLDSRNDYIDQYGEIGREGHSAVPAPDNSVYVELLRLYEELRAGNKNKEVIELVNAYVKSFEVRKRIYMEYTDEWKPLNNVGFEEYESYIIFAECLILAYRCTKCLKYFNCLLKLDDTLISIQDNLEPRSKKRFRRVLEQELNIFNQLTVENGINLEE
ncbi:MAG: hypothetical protein HDR29_04205 [Lachnospiraceae bacterium]|nr:hypothetical protein [Lachnospiraceae bacterium]